MDAAVRGGACACALFAACALTLGVLVAGVLVSVSAYMGLVKEEADETAAVSSSSACAPLAALAMLHDDDDRTHTRGCGAGWLAASGAREAVAGALAGLAGAPAFPGDPSVLAAVPVGAAAALV